MKLAVSQSIALFQRKGRTWTADLATLSAGPSDELMWFTMELQDFTKH